MSTRNKRIVISVTPEEKDYISNAIKFTGHSSVNDFVRDSIMKICDCVYHADEKEVRIISCDFSTDESV